MFTGMNFPIVTKVFAKSIGMDLVNVQPMNGPSGQLLYTDYVYGNRELTSIEKIVLEKLKKILDYEWQIVDEGENAYFCADCNDPGFELLENAKVKYQKIKIHRSSVSKATVSVYESGLLEKGVITAAKTGII